MNRQTGWAQRMQFVVTLSVLAVLPASGARADQDIKLLPPDGTAYGMNLDGWATAFWQWVLSIPQSTNPDLRFDKTGVRAGLGQRAPVWFIPSYLPGTSGTRTFVVPEGQAILLSIGGGVAANKPGVETEERLLELAAAFLKGDTVLQVSLDGTEIPNPEQYRATPPVFSITLPPGNIFGESVTAGKDARYAAAGSGYWLLFSPLSLGKHVLTVHQEGAASDTGQPFKTDWTFSLIIQKANEPLP